MIVSYGMGRGKEGAYVAYGLGRGGFFSEFGKGVAIVFRRSCVALRIVRRSC